MKSLKNIYLKIAFIFAIILIVSSSVTAQETGGAAATQRWGCLQIEKCQRGANNCSTIGSGHRIKLTTSQNPAEKPLPNAKTYVVECIEAPGGQICHTADAAADTTVYGGNTSIKNALSKIEYRFNGMFKADGKTRQSNPFTATNTGDIPDGGVIEWDDEQPENLGHKFFFLNYIDSTVQPTALPENGGQQQTVLDFSSANKICATVRWDPYGRVFDSQTLEPLTNIQVSLFRKGGDNAFSFLDPSTIIGGNIINPQTTLEDGRFNYVVPDGTYQLKIANLNIENDTSKIHPNYKKIYSDKPIEIYKKDAQIVQRGTIQHRDIPVINGGSYISSQVKMMSYFYEMVSGRLHIEGQVSHPFAQIKPYTKEVDPKTGAFVKGRLLTDSRQGKEIKADKEGAFKIIIDQFDFKSNEQFGIIELQKTDLTSSNLTAMGGSALSTTRVEFDPMPTNLEGYAYDQNKNVIPNAVVGVYLKNASKASYITNADKTGYFKIASANIPFMPYDLRFQSPNGRTITSTTSNFLTLNKQTIQDKKINPFKPPQTTTPSSANNNNNNNNENQGTSGTSGTNLNPGSTGTTAAGDELGTQSSNKVVVVTVLLILAALIGAGIYVFIKKRQTLPPPDSMM